MSADSSPPADPDLPTNSPAAESTSSLPLSRRRYKKPETGGVGGADNPDEEIIVLSSLLQNLLARKQNAQSSETEGEVRAKINRFVPRGTPPPTTAPAAPAVSTLEETPAVPITSSRSDSNRPEAMAAIAFPKFEPRAFQATPESAQWQRGGSWGLRVLYFAFAAALALAAFLIGRGEGRRTVPSAPALPASQASLATWTATFSDHLDRALESDHSGDLEAAHLTAETLQKNMGANPVLTAYLATLNTRLGRTNDVEADLSRVTGPNTSPAATALFSEAQGFNYARRREFDRAVELFTNAAQIQPFNTENLVHLAEAQRRAGRLAEAIGTFQQTLLRLPSGAPEVVEEREYLSYKQRLSQIEIGREAEFKTEMDRQLTASNASPYWLLTAAAVALQKNDFLAGVGFLQKARAALPPTNFTTLLNDYFFRSFIHHPEVVPFLTDPTVEQQQARRASMDFFIDP